MVFVGQNRIRNMVQFIRRMAFFIGLILLSACSVRYSQPTSILLWHSWEDTERPALDSAIARFQEVFPDIQVISIYVPENELLARYQDASNLGLGPDIFFGSSEWTRSLAEARLIHDISPYISVADTYLPNSVINVTFEDHLFGVPFSVHPMALFYNTNLVETPATTLDDLFQQASIGINTALNTRMESSFWGIQAFGGQVFDDDGRVILDAGGYANWLNWLKNAQANSGIFLSRDTATLEDLFLQESVAYYIAPPAFLSAAQSTLGEGNFAVTTLPSGPNGTAGPLLNTEALFFNSASSDPAIEASIQLAQFLTNVEQSAAFVREVSLVPANRRARIDGRAYPHIAAFATQARSSVAIPNIPQMQTILEQGNTTLVRVLEGVIEPNEAAIELAQSVNSAHGFEEIVSVNTTCAETGELILWHTLDQYMVDWLNNIKDSYEIFCPDVTVSIIAYLSSHELLTTLRDEDGLLFEDQVPHLILMNSTDIYALANDDLIQPVPEALMPQFVPVSQESVRFAGIAYGIPVATRTPIMYYDAERIMNPVTLINDLLLEASNGNGVAISTDFASAYWGISIFGEDLFNSQTLNADSSGLLLWLEWLKSAGENEMIFLSANSQILREMYIAGEVAYYLGWSNELSSIQGQMPDSRIGITILPDGTDRNAHPFIVSQSFSLVSGISNEQSNLALHFIDFVIAGENQIPFSLPGGWIPTSLSDVDTTMPFLSDLSTQLALSSAYPNTYEANNAFQFGSELYSTVLFENRNIQSAFDIFITAVTSEQSTQIDGEE